MRTLSECVKVLSLRTRQDRTEYDVTAWTCTQKDRHAGGEFSPYTQLKLNIIALFL